MCRRLRCGNRQDLRGDSQGFGPNKVLSLCLVDPFDFGIKFETLQRLSSFFIDFVVLLAIGMDANRNYDHYVDGHSTKIDEALGNTHGASDGRRLALKGRRLPAVSGAGVLHEHGVARVHLTTAGPHETGQIDREKLASLLSCAILTAPNAYKFWDDVLKYSTDQTSLWD